MKKLNALIVATTLLGSFAASADVYLQFPRGSNNRINEGTTRTTTPPPPPPAPAPAPALVQSFLEWLASL